MSWNHRGSLGIMMHEVEKPLPVLRVSKSTQTELGCTIKRTLPACLLCETVTDVHKICLRELESLRGGRKINASQCKLSTGLMILIVSDYYSD